jgi:hypothetical protein
MPMHLMSTPGGAVAAGRSCRPHPRLMLSPLSTTGHLIGKTKRQPRLELVLGLMNVGAYAFALSALVSTL